MPTYVIGDIHGQANLLSVLLRKLEVGADDKVVFLGDYVDRGPNSKGVVDALLQFSSETNARIAFLLGNHEQWLLRSLEESSRHSWLLGMNGLDTVRSYSQEAAQILESAMRVAGPSLFLEKPPPLPYDVLKNAMPREHLSFFTNLVPYARTPDVVCVHAGVSEDYVSVESESEESLVWGERDWWQTYQGRDKIVYGHWNNAIQHCGKVEPFICNGTYGIDCVASGNLLALRFPDLSVWRAI